MFRALNQVKNDRFWDITRIFGIICVKTWSFYSGHYLYRVSTKIISLKKKSKFKEQTLSKFKIYWEEKKKSINFYKHW
jgi:hypothetical protein